MASLNRACLGLLDLCDENPGPTIEEVFEYAPSYGLQTTELYPSLVILLRRELLRPFVYVDPDTFMPTGVIVTPAGEQVLRERAEELPRKAAYVTHLLTDKPERAAVLRSFPRKTELSPDVIRGLADAYLSAGLSADGATTTYLSEMYTSAARGYACVHDARGFVAAVRACLAAHEQKGKFLDLALEARDLAALYPEHEPTVIAAALIAIDEPYRDLVGSNVPRCESLDDLATCITAITHAAMEISKEYSLSELDPNALIGVVNRVEDILGEAFKLRSDSLYGQAVQLLYHMIELAESVVSIRPGAAEFEARAGFAGRINLARRGVQAIGGHRSLVYLPLPHSERAFDHVIAATRRVAKAALVPVWNSCRDHSTNSNTAAKWVIQLVEYSERRLRRELIAEMQALVPMHAMLSTEDAARGERETGELADVATLRGELLSAVSLLSAVRDDTTTIRTVMLPHLSESIGSVLAVARDNQEVLVEICNIVIGSSVMLQALDATLESEKEELRRDLAACIASVEEASALSDAERTTFLSELGKIANLSSAGKMVASIPLIPGFLKYSVEGSVTIDWNKWVEKLRSTFRRSVLEAPQSRTP